jgi:hypothetical protein
LFFGRNGQGLIIPLKQPVCFLTDILSLFEKYKNGQLKNL